MGDSLGFIINLILRRPLSFIWVYIDVLDAVLANYSLVSLVLDPVAAVSKIMVQSLNLILARILARQNQVQATVLC